jgi:hypothetical protein
LGDLEKLINIKNANSAVYTLKFAKETRKLLKDENLPSDLSINHDKHFLDKKS